MSSTAIRDLSERFGLDFRTCFRILAEATLGRPKRLERLIGPLRAGERPADAVARTRSLSSLFSAGMAASALASFAQLSEAAERELG